MNFIKELLLAIVTLPLYIIAKIIPKDKNLYIIGSSLGKEFADNPKYLFLYIHSHTELKQNLIWITKSRKVFNILSAQKLPVKYLYSLTGIYITIRASKSFISHQLNDINGALISGSEIIQLWHGTPIKKIGFNGDWFSTGVKGKIKTAMNYIFPYSYYMLCDKLIVPSEFSKKTLTEPFSHSFRNNNILENILPLGQARNDALKKDYKFDKTYFPELTLLETYKNQYKFIVAWLPTHRAQFNKTILDLMNESNVDIARLNKFCADNGIVFIIKPHFLELNILKNSISNMSNIKLLDAADPYPLLNLSDILITDYSSVYFDFLIKNKPIIFAPFDLEEYEEKVDFYFNYNEVTPGMKCDSWNCIIEQISLLINDVDEYKNDREKFIDGIKLVKYDNCEIIYDYFFID